ncbi:hypothetical protein [Georgenia muralis]|uniref:DUF8175 domain-containing protein n=1 Tax=Georgenia muralis TaxID=154117 RepID=A0A3N4Z5F3_9MICO|nr:hypothetical protein [Georgenia muralis]RPF27006.1 hypothetical protein EDD32_1466 [Georgenia muralis]
MADDLDDRSVWARPAFLVSAVLVVAVVVLGVWLAVANERRDDGAPPAASASATAGPDGTAATGDPTGEPGGPTTGDPTGEPTAGTDGATDGPADDGETGDGATGAAPPAGTDGTADPADPAAAGEPSFCGMGPAQTDGTVTRAPEGVAWELVGTVAAPALPGTGPGVKEPDGFRSCYAQSPTGALLAAANIVAMGSVDALLPRTTAELTATGPGRDAALARLDAEAADAAASAADSAAEAATTATPTAAATDATGAAATTAPPAPAPVPLPATVARYQIRGFHVIAYDGASASVDIALGLDNGALGSFVVDLLWQGGDWKVRLTDIGTLPTPPAQIPNLAGYTVWSGA